MANRQSVESTIVARALKDPSYKQKLLNSTDFAKAEIEKETGEKFPTGAKVSVLQESNDAAYLVLPYIAEGTKLSDADLENVASGVNVSLPCMFGSATFT